MTQAQAPNRNRPAVEPGGMQCENCDEIFIGEDWHAYCALCQDWFDRGRADANGELDQERDK